nr:MAG TPA: hypothetical protein [Crassvirales sp.]
MVIRKLNSLIRKLKTFCYYQLILHVKWLLKM